MENKTNTRVSDEIINAPIEPETISILLTPDRFPVAYKNKVEELVKSGAFNTEEEASEWVRTTPIELELIYEPDSGLFALESDAVATDTCTSPYSRTPIITPEE